MTSSSSKTVMSAFTLDQASRLTKVSARQLRSWSKNGFFVPSVASALRLYSFRDLVCLKVINALRNEAQIPLSRLREVKDRLAHLGDDLWAKTTLYILGRRVVFENPETGDREDAGSGQGVLQIPLIVVTGDMEAAVRALRQRAPKSHGEIDAKRAVVAGTRIPVQSIQDLAAAGYSEARIIQQYPSLTVADVKAAVSFRRAA